METAKTNEDNRTYTALGDLFAINKMMFHITNKIPNNSTDAEKINITNVRSQLIFFLK